MVGQSEGQLYSWFGGLNVARSISQSAGRPVGCFVAIHSVVLCRSFIQSLGKTKYQSVGRTFIRSVRPFLDLTFIRTDIRPVRVSAG